MTRGRALTLSALLIVGWVVGVLIPLSPLWDRIPPDPLYPNLPLVSSARPSGCVRSVVPDLFRTLLLAVGAAGFSELAKLLAARYVQRSCRLLLAITVQQGVLFLDLFRSWAWDWFDYLLFFLRLAPLNDTGLVMPPRLVPLWPPLLSLAVTLSVCVYITWKGPDVRSSATTQGQPQERVRL